MPVIHDQPTPYPDVNFMLSEVFKSVRAVLGNNFTGMYLDGSLVNGDFDQDSDIDFVVVTEDEIPEATFLELQTMHDRLAKIDSPWAIQLEGSYLSKRAIRRFDPAYTLYPNIERGSGERLKIADHDKVWDTHRYILRKKGLALAGPAPETLIDPVMPMQLRQAMQSILPGWATYMLNHPDQIKIRGYQSYIVLTVCRILYTLHHGTVVSKPTAARWVQQNLGERWDALIESAWVGRHNSDMQPLPEDMNGTQEFIRFALEHGRQVSPGSVV